MTIGERIRELRQERGWSQRELEARCGVSHNQLSLIEANRFDPRVDTLRRLAAVFEVPVAALIPGACTGDEDEDAASAQMYRDIAVLRARNPTAVLVITEMVEALNAQDSAAPPA